MPVRRRSSTPTGCSRRPASPRRCRPRPVPDRRRTSSSAAPHPERRRCGYRRIPRLGRRSPNPTARRPPAATVR
ncbi:hypothetical protein C5E45_27490 [Nocardia nova]|uniref:Uncharacterized protein n=1 Tax=Nocardia nova TaxID=37330 RepID=A0A2S6AIL8_9NOCA|nr:hypothetical protein C5E41_23715 [Nocardia nova]PPJ35076.1 hypothetical protein C5E45_27490 [Nocardia nova]